MHLPTRPALPPLPIPDLISGHDTTAQAEENRLRVLLYLAKLRDAGLALPADRTRASRLGIAQAAREAGVCLGTLRPGSSLRVQLNAYMNEAGLAVIVSDGLEIVSLSIEGFHERLRWVAPQVAKDEGLSTDVVVETFDGLMSIMQRRAKSLDAPAAPILASLMERMEAGELDLSDRQLRFLPLLSGWVGTLATSPRVLESMVFVDLFSEAVGRIGTSLSALAREVGVKPNTLSRWNTGRAIPNARTHAALRTIARLAGLPEDMLIQAIPRRQFGGAHALKTFDLPKAYRHRSQRHVVKAVRYRLREEDWTLADGPFRARVEQLCEQVAEEGQANRDRHVLRHSNCIDRSRFSAQLLDDFQRWERHLQKAGRSPATRVAYLRQGEAVLAHGLSDRAPEQIRLDPATARLAHLASVPLWEHHLNTMEANGRKATRDPSFRVCRPTIERLKVIEALFNSRHSYIAADQELLGVLRRIGAEHLPMVRGNETDPVLLTLVGTSLATLRKDWMKQSAKPIRGRDQIADLLIMPDPIRAVATMIEHQTAVALSLREPQGRRQPGDACHHFATAMRLLIVVHLLGQTALRTGMLPRITVGTRADCHLRLRAGELPLLQLPGTLFKNQESMVFQAGPYQRELEDWSGFSKDLALYMEEARPILLDGTASDLLFPVKGGTPILAANLQQALVDLSSVAIGANAPPHRRLIERPSLRPHHFRDILATQVLHDTDRNYALAADAIHVTERTCREYYAHDTPAMRRPQLQEAIRTMGRLKAG